MSNSNQPLSKQPYKGVRDFYPRDMFIQKLLFNVMRETAEEYGYIEYSASLLEPSELYEAKTGEEIVSEQTYAFTDRGDRDVTLRPEMTPTLARMVANRYKELAFPVRWYSLPNVFRYERPQRGRLREHWQLNADIFGVSSVDAEVEIILMAEALMHNIGATDEMFEIRISHRKLINTLFKDTLDLDEETQYELGKLIDKQSKMADEKFEVAVKDLINEGAETLFGFLDATSLEDVQSILPENADTTGLRELEELFDKLYDVDAENIKFDPTIIRGFDYYTGTVFEIFDTSDENNRSIAGGGRYDELLSIFDEERVPAVGFGVGDVTLRDFLETHDLLPRYTSSTDITLCLVDADLAIKAFNIAENLRDVGLHVAVDVSGKSIGTQIKNADNESVPFIAVIGDDELEENTLTVKHLPSGEEKVFEDADSPDTLQKLSAAILETR